MTMYLGFSLLKRRGWTRELLELHAQSTKSTTRPRWALRRLRAIEKTPRWREDAARAKAGHPVVFRRDDLTARGWTDAALDESLMFFTDSMPRDITGEKIPKLWRAARIEEAEKAGWV